MWKRILLYTAAGLAVAAGSGMAYLMLRSPNAIPAETIKVAATPEAIARGEYLFTVVADCDGCHTPRDWNRFSGPPDKSRRGAGFTFPPELKLPGQVTAPNITPDPETGIGAWTDGEKVRAIREGVSRDGHALFPMMPYKNFAKMSDDDVHALVAFLNSLPPIRSSMPRTKLDFPVNYLIVSAPAPSRGVRPVPQGDKLAWGEHLVTLASCKDCHTKAEQGELIAGMEFGGGERFQIGKLAAVSANISPDPDTGIGKMSEAEFIERFRQYRRYEQEGIPVVAQESFTIMPWMSFTRFSDQELSAIYAYLRTVKPVRHSVETHPTE